MSYFITALIGLATLGGGYFAPYDFPPLEHDSMVCQVFPSSRLCADFNLGAVSFPSSLDVFENPGASAQVSTTVTHSAHHGNANDALEALEAKVGTGASTPTNNTIFVGNGSGSSAFSISATSTNFLATNLQTASTTMGSTSVQTLLTTNGTSTNWFVSNLASSTALRSNTGIIGNLTVTTCTGCTTGVSSIEKASSTAANLPGVIATSTPLTTGHKVLIMGWCSLSYSNSVPTVALYVKPASSATSSALAMSSGGSSNTAGVEAVSVAGIYVVAATESHEIYLGTTEAHKPQTACDAGNARGITYVVLN